MGRIAAGKDDEFNQVALDEGTKAIEGRRQINDAQERLRVERKELQEVRRKKDEVIGALQESYVENLQNLDQARNKLDDIMERATKNGRRVDINKRRVGAKVAERSPAGTDLQKVLEGEMPPYEAQPLNRAVMDLQEIIDANPTRNDPLMNRIEAELHSVVQALDKLTTEADIPAREVNRILKDVSDGKAQPVMKAVLRDGWRELWDGSDVVIARDLEARFHRIESALDQPRAMGRLMTAYTNFFKTYATATPGFHVRNAMSAMFMNYSEGVSTATQREGLSLWRQFTKADNPVNWFQSQPKQIQDAFTATFASGAGGRFFESGVAEAGEGAGRFKELIFSNPYTRGSQRIGQDWVEGPVRLGLALHSVRQGQDVGDALNRVTRIHFDYSEVSQFDEKAKRYIPFWTFMSRNLPMQYTQMWSKPRTYLRYQSFVRNFSVEPAEYTPEYILEAGGFDTGLETPDLPGMDPGMPIFLQPDFAHTRLGEDVEKLENTLSGENLGAILSDLNPAITAPIEYATGKDLFTGRVYGPDDYRRASGATDMAILPLMKLLGQTKTNSQGDTFYQEKGVDALRSLIPILDRISRLAPQTAGGDSSDRQAESWVRFGGAPIRTVSEQQRQNQRRTIMFDRRDQERLRRVLEASE